MADWKQITARIRRARSGKDPAGQLANLYEKTSDAMVAFELAKLFESTGQNSDAAKWYSTAAARFRRAEWKTKAQEAAVRLGASAGEIAAQAVLESDEQFHLTPPSPDSEEKQLPFEQNPEALESSVAVSSEIQEATQQDLSADPQTERKHRRRGRRGGENRRRAPGAKQAAGQVPNYLAEAQAPPRLPEWRPATRFRACPRNRQEKAQGRASKVATETPDSPPDFPCSKCSSAACLPALPRS